MKRAHSLFEVKGIDNDSRVITGIASTPTPDRSGDIVEPKGAEFKLPLPFLWQHMTSQPVGHVTRASVSDAGIEITAELKKTDTPGALKNRLDEAWESLKIGLVRGLSIGFKPLESSRIGDSFSRHYLSWEWLELSAVTIPDNAEGSIQTVKAFDDDVRAALGQRTPIVSLDDSHVRRVTRKTGVSYLDQ